MFRRPQWSGRRIVRIVLEELQQLVDGLGETLGRPITIEDAELRLAAYSARPLDDDRARATAILGRGSSPEVKAWVLSLGIAEASAPVVAAANAELGMERSVCVPIRHQERLTGYIWIADPQATLGAEDLRRVEAAAAQAAAIMYRNELVDSLTRGRERELLRRLLSGQAELRRYAADALVKEELFRMGAELRAIVIEPIARPDALPGTLDVLETIAERARRLVAPKLLLALPRFDHTVMVVSRIPLDEVVHVAEQGVALANRTCAEGHAYAAGVGSATRLLADAHESYEQAAHAARVAAAVDSAGPVAVWDGLGVYRLLAPFATREIRAELRRGPLHRLIEADRSGELLRTLEVYLDTGGDVKATASALYLHRTSLYGRLNRIQEILGASLRDGNLRLELHVSLKLAQLSEPGDADAAVV